MEEWTKELKTDDKTKTVDKLVEIFRELQLTELSHVQFEQMDPGVNESVPHIDLNVMIYEKVEMRRNLTARK